MPQYLDVFISPIRDNPVAQVLTVALLALTALDVVAGVVNAAAQSRFSSHQFRKGLIRKLENFGIMVMADIIDGILLGGFDLGFQPIYVALAGAFCLMEVGSLIEIWADGHPEYKGTGVWRILESVRGEDEPESH